MSVRISTIFAAVCLLSPAAFAQDAPSDPQIAHIAYTAGVIDIEAANLAVKMSKNEDVIAFAKDMLRDHEVNGALETLLIPSAQNAELKDLLQTGLKLFQGHQQHAEHVATMLE